jgi:23S rRNA (guanine745-N1)-methyltransferase
MSTPLVPLATAVLHVPGRPERVLEVGCGEGEAVLFLAREYPAARVRGTDRSAGAIRAAVDRVGLDPEGRVAFKRGGPRRLPYPDGFFDLVVQGDGPLRPRELARVLAAGGHLLLVGRRRLAEWRLAQHGFDITESGEAGGEPFLLALRVRKV